MFGAETNGGLVALIVVAGFAIWVGLALIPAYVARQKGRSFAGYFVFGLVAFVLALIVAAVVPPRTVASRALTPGVLVPSGATPGTGRAATVVGIVVAVVAAALLLAGTRNTTRLKVFATTNATAMWKALLIGFVAGVVVGWLLGMWRRAARQHAPSATGWLIASLVVGAVALIYAVTNSTAVRLKVVTANVRTELSVGLLAEVVLGVVVGWLATVATASATPVTQTASWGPPAI